MDYEDTKRKAEKRIEWRMLSMQWKTCPWAEHYDWLICLLACDVFWMECVLLKMAKTLSHERYSVSYTPCDKTNELYADTKWKAEKRVDWRMLSLQRKTYPWAEYCDWLIDWLMITSKAKAHGTFEIFLSFFLSFFLLMYLPSSNPRRTSPGLTTQMPVGQMPVGTAFVYGPEHWTGRAFLNVWSA